MAGSGSKPEFGCWAVRCEPLAVGAGHHPILTAVQDENRHSDVRRGVVVVQRPPVAQLKISFCYHACEPSHSSRLRTGRGATTLDQMDEDGDRFQPAGTENTEYVRRPLKHEQAGFSTALDWSRG